MAKPLFSAILLGMTGKWTMDDALLVGDGLVVTGKNNIIVGRNNRAAGEGNTVVGDGAAAEGDGSRALAFDTSEVLPKRVRVELAAEGSHYRCSVPHNHLRTFGAQVTVPPKLTRAKADEKRKGRTRRQRRK